MQNKKTLATLSLLRKIIEIFFNLFLGIYLYKLVEGDLNFILLYAAFNAIIGCTQSFFIVKYVNSRNAGLLFKMSFVCNMISMLMLLVAQEDLINVIWIFAFIQRFATMSYYAVYEVTLIHSTKNHSLSSYVAGVNILGSVIAMIVPSLLGYIITNFSWHVVFILMLADTIISTVVASQVDFGVIHDDFRPVKYWKKISKHKTMRKAYLTLFFRRLGGTDGVLEYLVPILLFLSLGTEFSVGNYDSLFSVVYIIMLECVRIINKKGKMKRFYIPLAMLSLISAIMMVADQSITNILLFYFTIKTGGALIQTEGSSMIYAIGNKENLSKYTREHQFTWNIALTLGNLVGIIIAAVVYNAFYGKEAFAVTIVILMVFFVIQAWLLQRVEGRLKNA